MLNKVKKVFSILLSMILLLGLSVPAFATETTNLEFVLSSEEIKVEEEFTVNARLTANEGFNAFDIQLTYDESIVQFLGFVSEYDEDAGENVLVSDFSNGSLISFNDETANISLARTNDSTKTGTLFTAKFKALKAGNPNIRYDEESFNMTSRNGTNVAPTINTDELASVVVTVPTYEVSLPSGTGYTVVVEEGSSSPVESGHDFSFTVDVKDGYNSDGMVVKANETELTANSGIFTIKNITEDQTVKITGITAAVADSGYTVSLTPDTANITFSEKAVVNVKVTANDKTSFNTLYAKLSYNPSYLRLETTELSDYEITDNNGTVEIAGYGEDKVLGEAVTLEFSVVAKPESGTANVTLVQANVDEAANAAVQDAPIANYGDKTAEITVTGYKVELSDDFIGDSAVEAGANYTFTAKDKHYDYKFNATMNGVGATVVDNGDGTYTIASVSGNLVIEYATKTAKTFGVSVVGALEGQVTYADSATYMTDYVFAVSKPTGFNRTVTVEIDGTSYTGFSVADGTYTIPGEDITGDINITITNTAVTTEYSVEFEGNAAGEASAENMTVVHGNDFTFNLVTVNDYRYEVTAKMGEDGNVTVTDNADGTYTIANVTGDLVITINKTAIESPTVAVSEYVKLNRKAVYLVTASSENVEEGGALSYDGNIMSWSDEYNAYAYLVISDTVLTIEEAAAKIGFVKDAIVEKISHAGDINGTNVVDINDAQVVYNIYNANYADFNALSMKMFHNADINADKLINVNDAVAIVNMVLNVTTE